MKVSKLVLTLLSIGLVASGLTAQKANAVMINGGITIAGGATFDTADLATATRVNTWSDTVVESFSGDFTGFVHDDDPVAMNSPWIFSPSTPLLGLWSVGGFTYDLSSSTVVLQNSNFLLITGTGTVTGNGFDPTKGIWAFTTQSPSANGVFSFSAGTATLAPDGGVTAALLGVGLIGLELFRRRTATA